MLAVPNPSITRILLKEDKVYTDFNILTPARMAKAQMIGSINGNGISEHPLTFIPSIFNNSDKVLLINYSSFDIDFHTDAEKVINQLSTLEQLRKLRVVPESNNIYFNTWEYSLRLAVQFQRMTFDVNYLANWNYAKKDLVGQSVFLLFLVSFTKLVELPKLSREQRLSILLPKDESGTVNSHTKLKSSVIRNTNMLESFKGVDLPLGNMIISSSITSMYRGCKVLLKGNIETVSDMLLDLMLSSKFKILVYYLYKEVMQDNYTVTLLTKDISNKELSLCLADKCIQYNIETGSLPKLY